MLTRIRAEPLRGSCRIDGVVSAIAAVGSSPLWIRRRRIAGRRAVILSATQYRVRVGWVNRKRDELRHRSQSSVQVIKLIISCRVAGPDVEASVTIQRAIDAAVVGKVQNGLAAHQRKVHAVLVRMHL